MTQIINNEAYSSSWEHISDELYRLELRIRLLLTIKQGIQETESPFEQYKGLVLSEEEVYQLLDDSSYVVYNDSVMNPIKDELAHLEYKIKKRLALSTKKGIFLPLAYLVDVFCLSPFEEHCLITCLAVELERKYEKFYAFLQDDVTCKRPSVDLVMQLFCITPEEKLFARLSFVVG